MARHTWLTTRFSDNAIARGVEAYKKARSNGMTFDASLCFAGYITESTRQKTYYTSVINGRTTYTNIIDGLWKGAQKSGHKYSKGKNRENYILVGRRILCIKLMRDILPPFLNNPHNPPSLKKTVQGLYTSLYDGEDVLWALHDIAEELDWSAMLEIT